MDIRDIQALHARYTAQPVIIDITSHTAAMPALPAPDRTATRFPPGRALISKLRGAGRPALIAIAAAAVAAAVGMSAARIWQAMHAPARVTHPVSAVQRTAPHAAKVAESGDMPIDVAPARPLTASDLDSSRAASGASALSRVDPKSLAMPAPSTAASPVRQELQASTLTQVAASPIRATRPAQPTQVLQPQPVNGPVPATSQHQVAPVVAHAASDAPPATQTAQAQDTQSAAAQHPALRPLRHVKPHLESNTSAAADTPAPMPPQPKAPAAKSGEVQLF
jgi:hypothetical protein